MFGQVLERLPEQGRVVSRSLQVNGRLAAPDISPPLAEVHEPDEDPPCDRLLLRGQRSQGRIGVEGHGSLQARALAVARRPVGCPGQDQHLVRAEGEEPPFQPLPEHDQRFLDERQNSGLPGRVADHALDQGGFHEHAHVLGRADDRLAQAGLVQRHHLVAMGLDLAPHRRRHELG